MVLLLVFFCPIPHTCLISTVQTTSTLLCEDKIFSCRQYPFRPHFVSFHLAVLAFFIHKVYFRSIFILETFPHYRWNVVQKSTFRWYSCLFFLLSTNFELVMFFNLINLVNVGWCHFITVIIPPQENFSLAKATEFLFSVN